MKDPRFAKDKAVVKSYPVKPRDRHPFEGVNPADPDPEVIKRARSGTPGVRVERCKRPIVIPPHILSKHTKERTQVTTPKTGEQLQSEQPEQPEANSQRDADLEAEDLRSQVQSLQRELAQARLELLETIQENVGLRQSTQPTLTAREIIAGQLQQLQQETAQKMAMRAQLDQEIGDLNNKASAIAAALQALEVADRPANGHQPSPRAGLVKTA